jgi:putative PIN family toxin of toxin-antitoxin system
MIYAVIDTNVLVSSLLTNNLHSSTILVIEALLSRKIKPLYNSEVLAEYEDVLRRKKFNFADEDIKFLLDLFKKEGIDSNRVNSNELFPDPDDAVFYEVALSKEDAFVVTGNLKHFPKSPIVVTPAEILKILESSAH